MKEVVLKIRKKISELEKELSTLKNAVRNEEKRSRERMNRYSYKVKVYNRDKDNEFVIICPTRLINLTEFRKMHDEHIEIFGDTLSTLSFPQFEYIFCRVL